MSSAVVETAFWLPPTLLEYNSYYVIYVCFTGVPVWHTRQGLKKTFCQLFTFTVKGDNVTAKQPSTLRRGYRYVRNQQIVAQNIITSHRGVYPKIWLVFL